ncbi:hypothetical protein P6144_16730 [Sphingomonas sp. HITSZ_GF]|uniref:hypothetical protein n=1 Tax=Sphingomonas sp. HITSZ_GF TaxID=3037247 RepID=UPI00240D0479|nr:hypothetical protein [Sphingomonas sp. HITSZ_GF]MDG2535308.1 hypothetical protein [Sphingomonas sp. HITSZ_GF]
MNATEKAEPYFKAAQLAKDRLHTLQSTEWNMYYAVWLVLLATMYGIMTAFGGVLPMIGDGLYKLMRYIVIEDITRSILSRFIRSALFSSLVWIFFRQIKSYYLTDFYKANYKSLVTQRILYYLYLGKALQIAYGKDLPNIPPPLRYQIGSGLPLSLDDLAKDEEPNETSGGNIGTEQPDPKLAKDEEPNKAGGGNTGTGQPDPEKARRRRSRLLARFRVELRKLVEFRASKWMRKHWLGDPIHMPQKSEFRVEEILLPKSLRDATDDYRKSGVYSGRAMVMLRVTRLGVLMAALISFFAPIHPAAH